MNARIGNPILARQRMHANVTASVNVTDSPDILLGEQGFACLFAASRVEASTLFGILHIITNCASAKVCRIAAGRIVARMKNMHPLRNRAICQFVSNTVRHCSLVILDHDTAVTVGKANALPLPTVISATNSNFLPKPWKEGAEVVARKKAAWSSYRCIAAILAQVSLASTAAMTVTIGDFVCRIVRGILSHVGPPTKVQPYPWAFAAPQGLCIAPILAHTSASDKVAYDKIP